MVTNLWAREQRFIAGPLHHMMKRGVTVDVDFCNRKIAEGTAAMNQIVKDLGKPPTGNFLHQIIFDELNLPVVKCTQGHPGCTRHNASLDKKAMEEYDLILEAMGNPLAKQVTAYRGWQKTVGTNYKAYIKWLSPDGRLRCNYSEIGTRTGRLSCSDPNLQNIPKFDDKEPQAWNWDVKHAFVAQDDDYVLAEFDYSQLELRLAAAYAEEDSLLEVFSDPLRDVFDEMSAALGYPRRAIKVKVYAGNYGAGEEKIAAILGIPVAESKALHRAYINEYKGLFNLAEEVNKSARRNKFIKYWTGRRRHFMYPGEARKAFNSLLQGGGAEVVKSAMIRVFEQIHNEDCRMLLQIHDSIVFEIKRSKLNYYAQLISEVMADVTADSGYFRSNILERVHFPVEGKMWGTEIKIKPGVLV